MPPMQESVLEHATTEAREEKIAENSPVVKVVTRVIERGLFATICSWLGLGSVRSWDGWTETYLFTELQ